MMLCLSAKAQQFDVQLVPHIYTGGTHITCHGQSNGQVAAIITGGQAPYKILWSTGDTTNSISGLPAGIYSVMVHDAAYDTLYRQITLTQPASLAAQYSTSSYNGYAVAWQGAANAQMQVLPTGGVAPYKILWSDGDSSIIRSNMSVGTYQFTITDAAGYAARHCAGAARPELRRRSRCQGGGTSIGWRAALQL
ncbi:MAG: SprB repeat-containing protein [Flavobacteriales bacterium]